MSLVILDRDGVINKDSDAYIKSPGEWQPIIGSIEAICQFQACGYTVAVASNQSGIARGLFSTHDLAAIDAKMQAAIEHAGGVAIKTFYCQHGPELGCDCRKPAPGLLTSVSAHYQLSLENVAFVGDSITDIAAATAANCVPILVRTGNGRKTEASVDLPDSQVYDDLAAFAQQWCQA